MLDGKIHAIADTTGMQLHHCIDLNYLGNRNHIKYIIIYYCLISIGFIMVELDKYNKEVDKG